MNLNASFRLDKPEKQEINTLRMAEVMFSKMMCTRAYVLTYCTNNFLSQVILLQNNQKLLKYLPDFGNIILHD